MKKLFYLLITLLLCHIGEAQKLKDITKEIIRKSKEKTHQKVQSKIDEKIEKSIDSATVKKEQKSKTKGNKSKTTDDTIVENTDVVSPITTNQEESTNQQEATNQTSFITYGKFDFVPGEKIIYIEDFSKYSLGDFPENWNTNSTGELFTIEGRPGKWLMLQKDGIFLPEMITSLPDNFTLEFELACNPEFSFYSSAFHVIVADLKSQKNFTDWRQHRYEGRNGLEMEIHPTNAGFAAGMTEFNLFENGKAGLKNHANTGQFFSKGNNYAKVSIWRQKQRVRVYLNEEKIWDIPRGLNATTKYNSILFALGSFRTGDRYYLANIKLAVGAPDTRNKLITEGKFITRGILFDVNSEKIKPESYGTLKDIAAVLSENAEIKVKIVGHTDTDGDENSNLDLSKRRAESVKAALISEFSIDGSRMETDGKGEGQPVDKNLTPEGKANNRRVEFIRQS